MNHVGHEFLQVTRGVYRIPNFLPLSKQSELIKNTSEMWQKVTQSMPKTRIDYKFHPFFLPGPVIGKVSSTKQEHRLIIEDDKNMPRFVRDLLISELDKVVEKPTLPALKERMQMFKESQWTLNINMSLNPQEDSFENRLSRSTSCGSFTPKELSALFIYTLGPAKFTFWHDIGVAVDGKKKIPVDPNNLLIVTKKVFLPYKAYVAPYLFEEPISSDQCMDGGVTRMTFSMGYHRTFFKQDVA